MKKLLLFVALAAAALLCVRPFRGTPLERRSSSHLPTAAAAPGSPPSAFGRIPLQFIPNEGQASRQVDFYIQGKDKVIHFSPGGLTFILGGGRSERWAVRLEFVDANEEIKPVGLEKSGAVVSYFKGRPEDWKVGVPTYSKIAYRELWPGIDLVYSGTFDRVKYEFVVRPGADPARIKLAYRGAQGVRLTPEGRLDITTAGGGFQDDFPTAYQELGGRKIEVPVTYALTEDGGYGFEIGAYDRSRTLILDPAVLVSCGFLGGTGDDAAKAIAVDASGNIYVAGETSSADLIQAGVAGLDTAYNGGATDAFVAKLDPAGTSLVFCSFLGGSGRDSAEGLAVDDAENVYLAGSTDSTELTFPVKVGPDTTYNGGASDAFVAVMFKSGTGLAYSGYIGGSGTDRAQGIAVDLDRYAYVAGFTDSDESTFPVASAPDLTYNGGASDAFMAELDTQGGIVYCGYLGGAGRDEAWAITCLDMRPFPLGGIVFGIAGATSSDESTFPVLTGPDLTYNGGDSDAFVAFVNEVGFALFSCGYIGGAGTDSASGIDAFMEYIQAEDMWGIFYPLLRPISSIAGTTSSTEATFPVKVGPDLTYNGGASDAFVARLDPPSANLVYCGYVGGSGADVGTSVTCHRYFKWNGNGFIETYWGSSIAGYTSSTESTFPVFAWPDSTYNGGASDAFVAKVQPDGRGLMSAGFIGGSGNDEVRGIASSIADHSYDPAPAPGDQLAYVAGVTSSSDSSFPAVAGPDLAPHGGPGDAFVAEIKVLRPVLDSLSPSNANAGDPGFTMVVTGSDFVEGANVLWGGAYGSSLATSFVSSSELRAEIGSDFLGRGQEARIAVKNRDGGISNELVFEVRNPVPAISALFPDRATAGGAGFDLAVMGSGFLPGATVLWNEGTVETIGMSGRELQAKIPASAIASGGEYRVAVSNPAPTLGPSNVITLPVAGFALDATPKSATISTGQSATYTIQLSPRFGAFDSPISLSCSGSPSQSTVNFLPATVTPGAAACTATLTITTKAESLSTASTLAGPPGGFPLASVLLLIILPSFLRLCPRKRHPPWGLRSRRWLAACALVLLTILIAGCGVGGGNGDAGRTYQLTVTGTSGTATETTSVTLVVK